MFTDFENGIGRVQIAQSALCDVHVDTFTENSK